MRRILSILSAYAFMNAIVFALNCVVRQPDMRLLERYMLSQQQAQNLLPMLDAHYRFATLAVMAMAAIGGLVAFLIAKRGKEQALSEVFGWFSFFSGLFSLFSVIGRQWYFEFGTTSLSVIACALLSTMFVVVGFALMWMRMRKSSPISQK